MSIVQKFGFCIKDLSAYNICVMVYKKLVKQRKISHTLVCENFIFHPLLDFSRNACQFQLLSQSVPPHFDLTSK